MPSDPAGDSLDLELLDRYLTGSATPDERARVESLRRNDPTWRAFFTELDDSGQYPTGRTEQLHYAARRIRWRK